MIAHLPSASRSDQRIAWYTNGYHMLLRDLDAAVVVGDIASWIESRHAPLPSAADLYAEARLGLAAVAQADKSFANTAADALGSPPRGDRSSAAPGHP